MQEHRLAPAFEAVADEFMGGLEEFPADSRGEGPFVFVAEAVEDPSGIDIESAAIIRLPLSISSRVRSLASGGSTVSRWSVAKAYEKSTRDRGPPLQVKRSSAALTLLSVRADKAMINAMVFMASGFEVGRPDPFPARDFRRESDPPCFGGLLNATNAGPCKEKGRQCRN
ncbi:MAG: hypothetical protein IT210_04580 [Armatimonadetes bacterium]|nr:hypothetical protein [Armatimonadota bacterium]